MRTKLLLLCLLVLGNLSTSSWSSEQPEKRYTLGVLPYLSAVRLEPIYVPLTIEMSNAVEGRVDFRTASNDKKFFSKLKQQSYDIALIQPFWYPPAIDQYGYLPLVRFSEPLSAHVFVLDESPIKTLEDLRGKTIATPPAFVPIVHMAKRELRQRGFIPGKDLELKEYKAIDSCFQKVVIGAASACIGPSFAKTLVENKMNLRLRSVLETPPIPGFSMVVHNRVPAADREKIKNLLLAWGKDSVEIPANTLQVMSKGFVPSIDVEYDTVRSYIRELETSGN